MNEVQVYRTDNFSRVATVPVGKLPHGLWPSGDGTRIYVGLENDDRLIVIDTLSNKVISEIPIGQAPQAVVYVPNAVPEGDGAAGLQPLGIAGQSAQLWLMPISGSPSALRKTPTSVALFDQGLVQILQASVTGLAPRQPYVLALSRRTDGGGVLQPLAAFTTNPAGAAIVNALGPIREIVHGDATAERRYLVISPVTADQPGVPVQVQSIDVRGVRPQDPK